MSGAPNQVKTFKSKSLASDGQVAAAVELNTAEWLRRLVCLPWVQVHEEPDVLWCFAGDTWPANSVTHARFQPTTARHRIRKILAHHWEHKVACNWIVGPASQPAGLSKDLRDNGFSCRIHTAGMACDLAKLDAPSALPENVKIEMVDELPSLVPLTSERRQRRHEGRKLIRHAHPEKIWYFSATLAGQPVGETSLLNGAGVGGVYDVEVR